MTNNSTSDLVPGQIWQSKNNPEDHVSIEFEITYENDHDTNE